MGDEKSGACKLFIGGLSMDTDKDSLKAHFEHYGEIVDAVVMKDTSTKRSRGFGFVTYSDSKSVDDCLQETKHVVDGRQVEAKRAIPREDTPVTTAATSNVPPSQQTKKVFLGGLSLDTTEDEIREVLSRAGELDEVTVIREKESERPRGFGFAVFKSVDSVEVLCQKRYVKIKDRDVEVKKAISQEEMRRVDVNVRSRSGGSQGGYHGARDHYSGGGGGRDSYSSPYGRGGGSAVYAGGMGGYDYRGYGGAGDYARAADPYYGYTSYDRSATASAAYAYASTYGRGGYDMTAYGMYGGAAGMGAAAYTQTPSSYGPARTAYGTSPMGTGAAAEYGKDRGGVSRPQAYHPYRRQ